MTGAARGIGRSIAARLEAEGVTVHHWDRSWDPADLALPHRSAVDVTDSASVEEAMAAVVSGDGRVDILVNNAGVAGDAVVEDLADAQLDRVFEVNVAGIHRTCRTVIPIMKAQRSGRIINAASFAAIVPAIGSAAYAASKAAVVQYTRVMAGELGPWGVTANCYAPGMIPTAINRFTERSDVEQDSLLDTLTLRRWGTADEVASLVCFLASGHASYITGALIDVSGGKLATQRPQAAYELARNEAADLVD